MLYFCFKHSAPVAHEGTCTQCMSYQRVAPWVTVEFAPRPPRQQAQLDWASSPPNEEGLKRKLRKKTANRRDWEPVSQWKEVDFVHLGFKAPEREVVDRIHQQRGKADPPPLNASFAERCAWHEERGHQYMVILGMRMPAVNGMFIFYAPKLGEGARKWRRRLRYLLRVQQQEKKQAKEEERLSLPLWEQISRASQALGQLGNKFTKLGRDIFLGNLPKENALACLNRPAWKKEKKARVFGPKRAFGYDYQQKRLARKLLLAAFHEEWKEARFLRKEKMMRAVMIENHRVVSLRSALEKMAETVAREQYKQKPATAQSGGEVDFSKFDDNVFKNDINELIDPEWDTYIKDYSLEKSAEAQMDIGQDAHGDRSLESVDKKSNVEIMSQQEVVTGASLPLASSSNAFQSFSAMSTAVDEETLANRWLTIDSFQWKTSHSYNTSVWRMDYPRNILNNSVFKNSPNNAMFRQHMFWRGNCKVRFFLTSNVRQMGQLQISFYYGHQQDSLFANRANVVSASQRLHCLMSANTSNEVILEIPFEYIFPVMSINYSSSTSNDLSLGYIDCRVLVPLEGGVNSVPRANIQVSIAFENSKFQGMVGADLAAAVPPSAQMFSAFASIIAAKSLLDGNRDRPTMTAVGAPVIPINSSSWCIGNGQSDYSNILRLNPNNVLPYPEGRVPPVDEMNIQHVIRTFSIIDTFSITVDAADHSFLKSYNATPLDNITVYPSTVIQGINCYAVPALGVVSDLFAYWRGSIDFRFDVVAATELSASILICYIPKYKSSTKISFDQALTCPHTIYDIKENRQLNFKVPYVASHMFYPRRTSLSTEYPIYDAPGAIYVFVYNAIALNPTIPQKATFVVYMRAGEDFELGVPCAPSLGLSFNPHIFHPSNLAHRWVFVTGYYPAYLSTWRNNNITKNENVIKQLKDSLGIKGDQAPWIAIFKDRRTTAPIFRYGGITDHVCQFRPIGFTNTYLQGKLFAVKITSEMIKNKYTLRVLDLSSNWIEREISVTHLLIDGRVDNGYFYGYPMTENQANDVNTFLTQAQLPNYNAGSIWLASILNKEVPGQDYRRYKAVTFKDTEAFSPAEFIMEALYPPFQPATAQVGTQDNLASSVAQPQMSARSNASKLVWGEQFLDLKDLCRRYQLYASDSVIINKLADTAKWRTISMRFPVMPQGLDLDLGARESPNEYWNRTRDGPIANIASAYRFFTGGIRFRVCINVQSSQIVSLTQKDYVDTTGKIFVQHRPNVAVARAGVIFQQGSDLGSDDLELPGYAAYHQFDNLNNVISVEVPFYQNSIRTYLQRPSKDNLAKLYSTLGEIAIGLTVYDYNEIKVTYDIYYSLADDARFSVFVGFPPMIDASNIAPVEPQVGDFVDLANELEAEAQMFSWFNSTPRAIESAADEVKESISEVKDDIKDTCSNLKSITDRCKEFFSDYTPSIEGIQMKFHKYLDLIINAITNIVHCLISLNVKSICVAIVSFFTQLKLVSWQATSSICGSFMTLFSKLTTKLEQEASSMQPIIEASEICADAQMASKEDSSGKEEKDSLICSYISTIVAGIASLFNFTVQFSKNRYKDLSSLLLEGINKFTFTANHLFTFIKNNLIMIKRAGEWMFSDHPSVKALGVFKGENEDLYNWATKVLEITDPRKENKVFTSPRIATDVYSLAAQANIIQLKILELKFDKGQIGTLQVLIKKIHELRDRLAKTHTAPPVRFEPFLIEFTGSTGIGKSKIMTTIPYQIFKSLNLKVEGDLIYHRQIGVQYWNNLRCQPVLIIDEKFPVKSPGFLDVQLSELFQLKSTCVFNPNMADIPDKGIRYNPLLILVGSNCAFPALGAEVLDMDAVNRRRDMLIDVKIKETIRINRGANCKFTDLSEDEIGDKDKFEFLEFRIYRDVCRNCEIRQNCLSLDLGHGPQEVFTYEEILAITSRKFSRHYTIENIKYTEQLAKIQDILPEDLEATSLTDHFTKSWFDAYAPRESRDVIVNRARVWYNWLADHPDLSEENKVKGYNLIMKSLTDNSFNQTQWTEYVALVTRNNIEIPAAVANMMCGTTEVMVCTCAHATLEMLRSYRSLIDTIEFDNDMEAFLLPMDYCAVEHICSLEMLNFDKTSVKESLKLIKDKVKDKMTFVTKKINEVQIECLVIPSLNCIQKCSHMTDRDNARKFIYNNYIKYCNKINVPLLQGEDLNGKLPDFYLNGIRGDKFLKDVKEHKEALSYMDRFKKFLADIKDNFYKIEWKKWLKRLGYAIAFISLFGIFAGLWTFYTGGELELGVLPAAATAGAVVASKVDPVAEAHVSGDVRVNKHQSKLTKPIVRALSDAQKVADANMQGKIHNESSVLRKLRRNSFFLSVLDGSFPQVGRCIGLCGNYALCLQHFWEAWENTLKKLDHDEIVFASARDGKLSAIKLNFKEIKRIPINGNSSLCIIQLPRRIPLFLDIRRLIATESSHKNTNLKGCIYEMDLDNDMIQPQIFNLNFRPFKNLQVKGRQLWQSFSVHDGYEYDGFSGEGRCGSLLLGESLEAPILGIHIAGYPGTSKGFSELLTRETFLTLENCPEPILAEAEGFVSEFYVDAEVIGVGRVSEKFAHRERGTSRIVPSKLQEIDQSNDFKVLTQPAVLSKKDKRIQDQPFSPMLEGCKHHGKPLVPFDSKDLEQAVRDVKVMILANCKPQRNPIGRLTLDEAVGGIDGKELYEHIKFDTSEGFPFVAFRPSGFRNKKWLFEFDENNKYVKTHKVLKTILEAKWQQRLDSKVPFTVFTDCLKDTTIENEKVLKQGKTRIFSMSPVDFTIHQRMCTLDFVASYMTGRFNLEHMIGCNPDSFEWTTLTEKLLNGEREAIMTGDYSKYGDTIPFEFIKAAFEIIQEWYKFNGCYDQELLKQLDIMPYEIGHSVHLMFDHLYQCVCGQPSGNPLTVIINSIANSIYLRLAWLKIMKFTAYNSLMDFHKHITMFSYGDDLIVSLSNEVKLLFNAISISQFFSQHRLKFTNANKSDDMIPYTFIDDAEFLKRSFLPHPTRRMPQLVLAPLKPESIEDTPNWVWAESFGKTDSDAQAYLEMSLQVCEDSIRNAFGRGPEYYDKWCSKLQNFWIKQGVIVRFDSWEQMDNKIFSLHLNLSPYFKKISYDAIIKEFKNLNCVS